MSAQQQNTALACEKQDLQFNPENYIVTDTLLSDNSPVYYGYNILEKIVDVIDQYSYDTIFIVSCTSVDSLYGKSMYKSFRKRNIDFDVIRLPDGENNKNFRKLDFLCEELISRNISKDSIIVAFGGGTIGNVVGLAAALIFRGVRFVEVPTTSMGITDSALSNKQAINGRKGKNHFGVYHAPIFIWSDSYYSRSEPLNNTKGTLVEGIKNGFISDPDILDFFDKVLNPACDYTDETYYELLYRIINSKRRIIEKDPTEKRLGLILEYGHTFGHAIEWISHGAMTHGEAVAIGMCLAAELSNALGFCNKEVVALHYRLLQDRLGLDVFIPESVSTDAMIKTMMLDNKKNQGGVKFVLLRGLGEVQQEAGEYLVQVALDKIRDLIEVYRQKNPDTSNQFSTKQPEPKRLKTYPDETVESLVRRYDGPLRMALSEGMELAKKAKVQRGWHVLDIGSGTGYISVSLAEAVGPEGTVHCLDNSPQLLDVLQEKAKRKRIDRIIQIVPYDCTVKLPFDDGQFDAVFSSYLLHELDESALSMMLEVFRVLKPGGSFVVADYQRIEDKERRREIEDWYRAQGSDNSNEQRLRFSLQDLERMYMKVEFTNVQINTWFGFHMHAIGEK